MAFMVWVFQPGRSGCYEEGGSDEHDELSSAGLEFDTREEASECAARLANEGSPRYYASDDPTYLVIEGFRRKRPV